MYIKYSISLLCTMSLFAVNLAKPNNESNRKIRPYNHEQDLTEFFDICKKKSAYLDESNEQCLAGFLTRLFFSQQQHGKHCGQLAFKRVVTIDGKVVGFSYATIQNKISGLVNIYFAVKKPYEFTNVHQSLVQDLILHCKQGHYSKAILEIPANDKKSAEWYAKLGFYAINSKATIGDSDWDCDTHYAVAHKNADSYIFMAKSLLGDINSNKQERVCSWITEEFHANEPLLLKKC